MEIAFDERGLVPSSSRTGDRRGPDPRLRQRGGRRAHARDRRAAPVEPLARRAVAQGRDVSGNVQEVRALRLDCDGDALLALVEPAGPACHTGERTCFSRGDLEPPRRTRRCPALERTLAERARERPAGSYTVELLDDPPRIGAKVQEEAEEVARAAREETDDRVDEEAADVLYHLTVLLHSRGRSLADAEEVLDGRRR